MERINCLRKIERRMIVEGSMKNVLDEDMKVRLDEILMEMDEVSMLKERVKK